MISFIFEIAGVATVLTAVAGFVAVRFGLLSITLKDNTGNVVKFGKV